MKASFYKNNSDDSMMRKMSIRIVTTASFVSVLVTVAVVFALIWQIVNKQEINSLIGVISGLLGGSAGIIGTLLIPAFGGKVGQKFAEKKDQELKK